MCVASTIGVLIELIGIKFKKKNMITVLFISILFIGYFIFISDANHNDIEIRNVVDSQLFRIFPLSKLFFLNKSIVANTWIYILSTMIILTLYLWILGKMRPQPNRISDRTHPYEPDQPLRSFANLNIPRG